MTTPERVRVLFVCVGNACRSPMAEAIARREAADVMDATSAGLYPLGELASQTLDVLVANGYAVDGLSSKYITSEAVRHADVIVNMTGRPNDLLRSFHPFGFTEEQQVEDWEIADPYGEDAGTYQTILEQLERRVRRLAYKLRSKKRSARV